MRIWLRRRGVARLVQLGEGGLLAWLVRADNPAEAARAATTATIKTNRFTLPSNATGAAGQWAALFATLGRDLERAHRPKG
jgi:hypothetical protein